MVALTLLSCFGVKPTIYFWSFFGHRLNCFFKRPKKICQICPNVRKYGVVNTNTAGFNTVMEQMTKISQREKKFC